VPTRRRFLLSVVASLAAGWLRPAALDASSTTPSEHGKHPDPRPGVDASKILPVSALKEPSAAPAFEDARAIPEILDGIRCHCDCGDGKEKYSLLSCYEGDGMAQLCDICQGQARLARRLVRLRRSLAQIRDAIDAKYTR
jgi:hypothetical protein